MHRFVSPRRSTFRRRRAGLTIMEMLVAAAITLILMVAIVQIFGTISEAVAVGRATIEMSGQMRSVTHTLQEDLDGVTIPALPWARAGRGGGYFEYIDGTANPAFGTDGPMTFFGDVDDILAFTARSKGEPFTGRFDDGSTVLIIESQVAEVIWWTQFLPRDDKNNNSTRDVGETVTLFRRVLLVRPDLSGFTVATSDISVGFDGSTPNSLADLTLRQNRYTRRSGDTFPYEFDRTVLAGDEVGDNVVLNNCLAFDARAFDPLATVAGSNVAGAYIHLSDANYAGTWFSDSPHTKSGLTVPTYDTWPFFYERDGVNQDGDSITDEGTNRLDDNNADGVDDVAERETSPPYPRPLRGLQVRLRMIETASERIRPATIVCDFVPE